MTTADRIRAMLVKDFKLDPEVLTLDAPLEELGVDSIGMAELMFSIEDEFSLVLKDEPVTLVSFGDVVHHIDTLLAARGAMAVGSDLVPDALQTAP